MHALVVAKSLITITKYKKASNHTKIHASREHIQKPFPYYSEYRTKKPKVQREF